MRAGIVATSGNGALQVLVGLEAQRHAARKLFEAVAFGGLARWATPRLAAAGPRVRAAIDAAGIELIGYRDLVARTS